MKHLLGSLLLCCCSTSFGAQADPLKACESLAETARIEVIFEDAPISRNNRLGSQELKRLSSFGSGPYHSILGITHAKPEARLESNSRILNLPDGRACTVPNLKVRLSFSELEVFIARDIPDDCRRRIVEAHEMEHVAIWRTHFRVGARMMERRLQTLLAKPVYGPSTHALEQTLKEQIDTELNRLLNALHAGATAANQQLDSALSYQRSESQMLACP